MSKQVNYNENLCAGAAIRDDKGRRISKLFEAPHPKMTVGYAKNLIMPSDPEEQKFNFRQSGGGVIEDGLAVIDKVKGNSVVWNQLMKFGASTKTDNGITYEIKEDGRVHIYGTATARSTVTYYNSISVIISGHKYIIVSANNIISGEANGRIPAIETQGGITTCNQSDANPVWYFRVQNGVTIDVTFRPQLIDVTQMFGAGNEPATVEEFLQRKPKVADEYAYNEGTIVNNKVEKVVTTGRNLWDEECETSQNEITSKNFNPIIPGVRIYVKCPTNSEIRFNWYDANKEYVSYYYTHNVESQVPANAHYFKILTYQYGTTYNHDICINLSDPTINGKYFPYEEHELDLSWVKEIKDGEGMKLFEDGMKSAGTAFDEVRKNKAVKRLGVKVFDGTEGWMFGANIEGRLTNVCFLPMGDDFGALSKGDVVNMICSNYEQLVGYSSEGSLLSYFNTVGYRISKQLTIKDSAYTTSVETWKSHLADLYAAGTPLVVYYELAEPIEVEYDEKNLTYPVVAGGTEEAIASEPSTAFRADVGYGIDAVKTILDLKARVEALEGK